MDKEQLEKLLKELHDMREESTKEINLLKKGQHVPAELAEKIEKMNTVVGDLDKSRTDNAALESRLKEQEEKLVRLEAIRSAGGTAKTDEQLALEAHSKAFGKFIRTGEEEGLKESFMDTLRAKAITGQNGPDGGFAIPEELDRQVYDLLQDATPMRSLARIITVGSPDYKKLVNIHGSTSGWVGEEASRTETTAPDLAEVSSVNGEIYAAPKATSNQLDDAFFNVEGHLAEEIAKEIALEENLAFTLGNGVVRPRGFLDYPVDTTADATRAFGTLQNFFTGADGAFATTSATVSPADDLIDMVQATKKGHRAGCVFMCNTLAVGAVRKMKDNDGAFIWQPGIQAGEPSQLLGFPLWENEDMVDIGTDTVSLTFGNFQNGYYIVDRALGTSMLRDPYTDKPYVVFYTTKRVGGMVVDSEAIKVLTFGSA